MCHKQAGGDNTTKPKLQECQQLVFPPLGRMQSQLHPPRCSGGGSSSRELFLLAGLRSFSYLPPQPCWGSVTRLLPEGKTAQGSRNEFPFFFPSKCHHPLRARRAVISQAPLAVHKCSHISLLVMNGEELKIGVCCCFDELGLMRELRLRMFLGMLPFTSVAPRSTEMIIFSWQIESQS